MWVTLKQFKQVLATRDEIKEGCYTYRLAGGIVVDLELVLTTISRTSWFDERGETLYSIQHQLISRGHITKDLRKNLRDMAING
jgi:hypothetical protein